MNYKDDDYDVIDMNSFSSRDNNIYSNSPQDIYSSNKKSPKKKKKKKKHIFAKIVAVMLVCVILFCGGFYIYGYKLIDKVTKTELDETDLGISTDDYSSVKNIALLGIDAQEDTDTGRSDAIVVVTVDKKNNKIKMTSIARDSYVDIDGHGKDKLTHAYAYGKSQLAVKTLNQNFDLEITDYLTVNFFEFARIIDYVGGVTVDVSEEERVEMNTNIIPWLDHIGVPCEPVAAAGVQLLDGGQAVSYARIRHTDSDIERGNRQKEVLMSMFAQVKKMNPLKLPKLAGMILEECETSLKTNDIISLGLWAVLRSPEIEQLSIPNDNFASSGGIRGGVWYYIYDLDEAKADIYDFIFEKNFYSPEEKAKREAAESEAK
ncbi:MAG: LCP family protein [Clostridia bacterium]|nr:LCP family protein [Clostridia bacterium]